MIIRLKKFFITTLIGGLVVILPITIFILITRLVIRWLTDLVRPIANWISTIGAINQEWNDFVINSIALATLVLFCFVVGLVVRTQLGKQLWNSIEHNWLEKLPLYGIVKETVQQFSGAKEQPFSKVVLVDPYNSGNLMTGFITDEHDNGMFTVFVPTAPNPTNGFVFHAPAASVQHIDVDSDDALRSIIGIGFGSKKILNLDQIKNNVP